MTESSRRSIEKHLAGSDPDEIRHGLTLAAKAIDGASVEETRTILEMVSSLFYIDPLDRPELVPLLEEAIDLVASSGGTVVPFLVEELGGADVKAQMAVAHVFGRMGSDAIDPLLAEFDSTEDTVRRSFILYALGKIKSPEIVRAVPILIESCGDSDPDLRDTATRAIGKTVESIPGGAMPDDLRAGTQEILRKNLADRNPAIRAKAVRSLGKLAFFGHLSGEDRRKLRKTLILILGKDENFEWDRAYLVRREAEEALDVLEG